MTTWREISPFTGADIDEDAPANAVGTGSVAGLGVEIFPVIHVKTKEEIYVSLEDIK